MSFFTPPLTLVSASDEEEPCQQAPQNPAETDSAHIGIGCDRNLAQCHAPAGEGQLSDRVSRFYRSRDGFRQLYVLLDR